MTPILITCLAVTLASLAALAVAARRRAPPAAETTDVAEVMEALGLRQHDGCMPPATRWLGEIDGVEVDLRVAPALERGSVRVDLRATHPLAPAIDVTGARHGRSRLTVSLGHPVDEHLAPSGGEAEVRAALEPARLDGWVAWVDEGGFVELGSVRSVGAVSATELEALLRRSVELAGSLALRRGPGARLAQVIWNAELPEEMRLTYLQSLVDSQPRGSGTRRLASRLARSSDAPAALRARALWHLLAAAPDEARELLPQFLADRSLRRMGVRVSMEIGREPPLSILAELLASNDTEDVQLAASAAASLGLVELEPDLIAALYREGLSGRVALVQALGAVGGAGSLPALPPFATRPRVPAELRRAAMDAVIAIESRGVAVGGLLAGRGHRPHLM